MHHLLVRNVRLGDGNPIDVLMKDGRFAAFGPNLAVPQDCAVEDGGGALALPGLVEGHTHLDKTLWGMPWYRNEVGPRLTDRIDNERHWRAASGHDAGAQSLALARAFLANGTTRLRTHVDIDTDAGLRHLHGVLATRDTMREAMEIQIVAFPQSGVLGRPAPTRCWPMRCTRGPISSAAWIRARSRAIRCARWMACSRWPIGMAAGLTSTCTNPARWAPTRCG